MKNTDKLRHIILSKAFMYSEIPRFKLAYGGISSYYFNCKPVLCDPEALDLIARLIFEKIKEKDVDLIGGLAVGALPISTAVSLEAWRNGKALRQIIVREKEKEHGIVTIIEGNFERGQKAVIVDDVITTGTSTIKAIEKTRDAGLEIKEAIILVDREEGGKEKIERLNVHVESLVTKSDIFDLHIRTEHSCGQFATG